MTLKDTIGQIGTAHSLRARLLPPTPKMTKVAALVAERMTRLSDSHAFDIDALQAKLVRVCDTEAWSAISERDLRFACFCLWRTLPPLAENTHFLDGYFAALRRRPSRTAIRLLVRSYFLHFDAEALGIFRVAQFLAEAVRAWRWNWALHSEHYRIFDPAEGPRRLADAALASGLPRRLLETVGLRGQLAGSPFAAACFRAALEMVGRQVALEPSTPTVRIVTDWATQDDGRLAFYSERNQLAAALLLPWEHHDPPAELRSHLRQFFLDTFKDPRISRLAWDQVSDVATGVILRWLAQGSLEQFLRVVDRTAPVHQWDYRRAFWSAYIDRGCVRDAWVAFGPSGQAYARRLANDTRDTSLGRFGRLNGAYDGTQAVLLLRIGDLVIADWSHNGMLRIWRHQNPATPSFYRYDYRAIELRRGCDFSRVHSHPQGNWQAEAAEFIRRHTGIRLAASDYMPKARPR